MGITISCKKTGKTIDMGYIGFKLLRDKIAELYGGPFAEHYKGIERAPFMGEARKKYFEAFDRRTEELIQSKKVSVKIVDFLLQPDTGGAIRYGACKEILNAIGDYDDDIRYGYAGRKDCAMFCDFKAILQDCAEHKCDMVWG